MTIPEVDDLDAELFTDLLRIGGRLPGDVEVTSVELTPLGGAAGMMSQVLRATLTYSGLTSSPATVIVKSGTSDPHRRFVAEAGKLYQREVNFYQRYADDVPVRAPKGIYADIDLETNDFILILEDVGQLRSVDQVEGVSLADATAAVQAMARWHSRWWGADLEALSEHFFLWNGEFNKAAIPMVFGSNWDAAKAAYAGRLPPEIVALGDRYVERSGDILDGLMEPNTLVHSDFRADNLLFDGAEPVLLDFQMLSVGCGMFDFAFFVSQSLTAEARSAHFEELLTTYLGELAAHGIVLDREVALDKYRRALVFGLAWPVSLASGFAALDARGKALAYSMLDRFVKAVTDVGAASLYA